MARLSRFLSFSSADLSIADLSIADLSIADLSLADLSIADLSMGSSPSYSMLLAPVIIKS